MKETSLVKGIMLLEALATLDNEATLARLVELTGIVKPTAHRLLQSLAQLGYVEHREGGFYQLTGRLGVVASGFGSTQLCHQATPILQRLSQQTGETINLGVLRNGRVAYLVVLESQHALRRVASPGETDPFYCTALGRAIVAHLPRSQQERLLQSTELAAHTTQTVTDRGKLEKILEKVRQDGWAIEIDQNDLGVTCVGGPVFCDDQVLAAISLSVPTIRTGQDRQQELIEAVRQAAADLTCQLDSPSPSGTRGGTRRGRNDIVRQDTQSSL